MADRPNHLPGYPVPPNNFMNLAQQQQHPMAYQQPQAPLNQAQQIPGVGPEHQRMWQQIQNSHRAQMGGADGAGQQQFSNQQMAELLRSQALSQTQNQQQQPQQSSPPQLQQAQQFPNLGGTAQMNNGLPTQNPMFAMQRQPSGGMGGLQNTQFTPQMAQMLAAQRNGITNPAMIQMNRQLGLLNRAQKQQPQNGPANFGQTNPPFGGQQNLSQLPFQAGMFPPKPDDGRISAPLGQQQFSTPPGGQNGLVPASGMPSTGDVGHLIRSADGRLLTFDEIRVKVMQLKRMIDAEKNELTAVPAPNTQETMMAFREKKIALDHKEKLLAGLMEYAKQLANRQRLQQQQQQQQAQAISSNNDGQNQGASSSMGFPNASHQQQTGQPLVQPNQNWMPHPNNAVNALPGNPPLIHGASQSGQGQGPHQQMQPSLIHQQQHQHQQAPVPRSAPTPQQQQMLQAFLQNNGQASPPSSGSAPPSAQSNLGQPVSTLDGQGGQQRPAAMSFPPFARDKFLGIMREWWRRSGMNPDPRLLAIGNRQIDLHQLHTEVLQYGGVVNVNRHSLWNVIAAKMGWNPTSLSEAGRTQEQVDEQLKTVYEQLLETFELTYMSATMKQSFTSQPNQNADPQGGPNQPSAGQGQPAGPNQALSAQQVMQMMKLANMTVEQMRAAGYNEHVIRNIEQNRPTLQESWRKMQMQRLQVQQQAAQQQAAHLQQQGAVRNTSHPFQNQLQSRAGLHNSSPFISENGIYSANGLPHPGVSGGSDQPADISAQQRPQLNAQHLASQNMGMLNALPNLQRPTPEAMGQANALMEQLKQSISKERIIRPEHFKQLSDVDKGNFLSRFEDVCKALVEIPKFLPMHLATMNDVPLVKVVLNMVDLCTRQRQFLQSANPMYILDIPTLERLANSVMDIQRRIGLMVRQLKMLPQGDQNQPRSFAQQQNDGVLHSSVPQQGPATVVPRPPTVQPQLQPPHQPQQNLRPLPTRTPQMTPDRPPSAAQSKQKGTLGTSPVAIESASSPSASTPLPSATTPNHLQTSPQTPKSPKTKSQAKPKRQRRTSKVVAPASTPATTTASTSTPAAEPAPSPAQAVPSPADSSNKRPREEDDSDQSGPAALTSSVNEETPSKRAKTDWVHVSETEPLRRHVEAESIKTPGQAAQFYSDMTQLLELTNNSALPSELQDTLAQLAKTVGSGFDIPDVPGSSSASNLASAGTASPKATDGDDSFLRFLDFSSFQQDDDKPDTPELVPTSSTNPSPESGAGSEADHPPPSTSTGSVNDRTKVVDSSGSGPRTDYYDADPLRLGIWGEIDGGESGYFSSTDTWKWDSVPPSSGDNSWAIST
ncbi:uncharacterized protein FOMMEDRAFT_138512 [Fomitiporia mediterranea MF3/22]|uniref:uncharacterized protein n=1 Tax=Fomitiporia mediterranea (strain MF3/22) TaxID=694068 RepID=UPI00044075DA|nr:uncharacterized protein FOMMEDRAFT_138512 [Fomitiporia mediterranea MF3/22]EJD06618.1 hypothetical protein FOMMEDRAFT_138512 [Fomitiporia mediterranea MF3/22]